MKVHIGPYRKTAQRKIKVEIAAYDTWNMDSTLALIIAPMLKQLKETKHGAPFVDDADVPESIRSTAAPAKENEWDVDELHFDRWDYALDEMIWAMEQVNNDSAEDQFYDHSFVDEGADIRQQINNIKCNYEGLSEFNKRKQKGFLLFGKYFSALWD